METEVRMQIFNYGNPAAPTVLIQPVDDHARNECRAGGFYGTFLFCETRSDSMECGE